MSDGNPSWSQVYELKSQLVVSEQARQQAEAARDVAISRGVQFGTLVAELRVEVAVRDRMLRLAWFDFTSGDEPIMPDTIDDWLADLKARAEEGSEP